MSDLDEVAVKKLKVAELRAELQSRGLDSKGNKPVLVERLLEAISKVDVAEANGDQAMEETAQEPTEEAAETEEETPAQESEPDVETEVQKVAEVTGDNETVSEEPAEVVAADPAPAEEKPLEKPAEIASEPTPQEEVAAEKQEDDSKAEEPMETSQEIPSTNQASEGWCRKNKLIELICIKLCFQILKLISSIYSILDKYGNASLSHVVK